MAPGDVTITAQGAAREGTLLPRMGTWDTAQLYSAAGVPPIWVTIEGTSERVGVDQKFNLTIEDDESETHPLTDLYILEVRGNQVRFGYR